jgi:UDP-glucose 4-epimerase
MTRSILVTGGSGFLGRAVAGWFRAQGEVVYGIGHGVWDRRKSADNGFDEWRTADVTVEELKRLCTCFDVIVHCAGGSAVGASVAEPGADFGRTVVTTNAVLEFVRLYNSKARLIYPSSAGVYGASPDHPIREGDRLNPIAPYGYHKRAAEEMCEYYSKIYGVCVTVIRLFSVYGPGLRKQLLWDGAKRIVSAKGVATFWGTGEETRDWIHVRDASRIIEGLSRSDEKMVVVNGASGVRTTVRRVLEMLRDALQSEVEIAFNGTVREGDPRFYHADVSGLLRRGMRTEIALEHGIGEYADWVRDELAG